jgi:hypothetical protein
MIYLSLIFELQSFSTTPVNSNLTPPVAQTIQLSQLRPQQAPSASQQHQQRQQQLQNRVLEQELLRFDRRSQQNPHLLTDRLQLRMLTEQQLRHPQPSNLNQQLQQRVIEQELFRSNSYRVR